MKFIPTSPADVEKLKTRAKVLKRNLHIPHREALERAAREKGYLHWHHVTLCQKESDLAARTASYRFLCQSIQQDALRGETHYLAGANPLRYVLFANGLKDAALLDMSTREALVLAVQGEAREFTVEDDDDLPFIDWHGEFHLVGETVVVEEDTGGQVRMRIDPVAFNNAVQESSASYGPDIFEHNLDDPNSAALLDTVLNGTGLIPITKQLAEELVASGYSAEQVVQAMRDGAMYSTSRKSIFYPPEVG